jgi:WD40 repeat protein
MDDCSTCANDAYRLVLAFYDPISESIPHLYVSALALAPEWSEIAQRMRPFFPNIFDIAQGGGERWSPCLRAISHHGPVYSVAFSLDGRRIASGSDDVVVRIWDSHTGAAILDPLQGHSDIVLSVAFSSDGRRIVSGSHDNTLRIWDAETGAGALRPLRGHSDEFRSVVFSPDGHLIASGSHDTTVRLWDTDMGAAVLEPLRQLDWVLSIAFSPDGRYLVSSGDFTLLIWDTKTGNTVFGPLCGHSDAVWRVAFSTDGCRIVSGSDDGTVRIWSAEPNAAVEPLQTFAGTSDIALFGLESFN